MIAVCPNPFRDINLECTKKAVKILNAAGVETVICPVFSSDPSVIPDDITASDLASVADKLTCAVIIGGDGTILDVVSDIYKHDIPIIGINLGTKGFMASLEPENLDCLSRLITGEYRTGRRMMLDVRLVRNGETICTGTVLNDAVIHGYGDTILMETRCDGVLIKNISGDGIIISTPTGSTGYSVSAGGPIVEPDTESIIVSPICAHSLGARSLVLDWSRVISIKVGKLHDRRAYLSLDGKSAADLANDDIIIVKKSDHTIKMIDFELKSFFETAFEKLS